jgi:hypothetical protein
MVRLGKVPGSFFVDDEILIDLKAELVVGATEPTDRTIRFSVEQVLDGAVDVRSVVKKDPERLTRTRIRSAGPKSICTTCV